MAWSIFGGSSRVSPHITNIDDHAVHPLPLELLSPYFTKRETTLSPANALHYLLQVTWQWVWQVLVLFLSLEDLFKILFCGLTSHHWVIWRCKHSMMDLTLWSLFWDSEGWKRIGVHGCNPRQSLYKGEKERPTVNHNLAPIHQGDWRC